MVYGIALPTKNLVYLRDVLATVLWIKIRNPAPVGR